MQQYIIFLRVILLRVYMFKCRKIILHIALYILFYNNKLLMWDVVTLKFSVNFKMKNIENVQKNTTKFS
jgi:hypothetical protein